jgi:hypothetical protein
MATAAHIYELVAPNRLDSHLPVAITKYTEIAAARRDTSRKRRLILVFGTEHEFVHLCQIAEYGAGTSILRMPGELRH